MYKRLFWVEAVSGDSASLNLIMVGGAPTLTFNGDSVSILEWMDFLLPYSDPVVLFVWAVQSLYSHNVVHLPLLSGFIDVTVWNEHFVQQVWAVQTFSCRTIQTEYYWLCFLDFPRLMYSTQYEYSTYFWHFCTTFVLFTGWHWSWWMLTLADIMNTVAAQWQHIHSLWIVIVVFALLALVGHLSIAFEPIRLSFIEWWIQIATTCCCRLIFSHASADQL